MIYVLLEEEYKNNRYPNYISAGDTVYVIYETFVKCVRDGYGSRNNIFSFDDVPELLL